VANPAPFVGRAAELRRLGAVLREVLHGSRIVAISGEAGAGKTRLIEQFRHAASREARFLVGRGSPLAAGLELGAVVEALEGELRSRDAGQLRTLCGNRAGALAGVLPSVAAAVPGAGPASPIAVLEALLTLLRALGAERSLVVVLDDAHEADRATWDLVGYLGRNRIDAPVLLVLSLRTTALSHPGSPTADTLAALFKDGLAEEVRVGALSEADLGELAQARLGPRASPDLVAWLARRSGGNALFAVALLDEAAVATGHLRGVPASVRERVRRELASMDTGEREVLQLLSVAGSPLVLETLTSLREASDQVVEQLCAAGLVTSTRVNGDVVLDYAHPLFREAVYEDLPAGRRRRLHAELADALVEASADVRAFHAARGGSRGEERFLSLVCVAAEEARQQARHRSAVTHLRAALDLASPTGLALQRRLLDQLAEEASADGDSASGVPALRRLVALASDPVEHAQTQLRLASLLAWCDGDVVTGVRLATEALRVFEREGSKSRIPSARNEVAWLRGAVGDFEAQMEGSRLAAAEARGQGDSETLVHALGSLGCALVTGGRVDEGLSTLRESLQMATRFRNSAQIEWHTAVLADELGVAGRFDEALRVADRLDKLGEEISDLALSRWAWLLWSTGRWRDALQKARLVQVRNPGLPPAHSAWGLAIAASVLSAAGDVDAARPYQAQADRVLANRDIYWFSAWNDWLSGAALLAADDGRGAQARLSAAADRLDNTGATGRLIHVLPDLVRARLAVGDVDGAGAAARRSEELAGELGHATARALSEYAGGMVGVVRRDPEAAPRVERACVALRELGLLPAAARAMEALGWATAPGAMRNQRWAEAARMYGALPDVASEQHVLAHLRQAGPAGRRVAQGVGALTSRERQISLLAREGMTVRAIAERLFLSERTVESHLAHSYDKLGVSGRAALRKLDDDLSARPVSTA